jgi:hypothetical protein
LLHLFLKLTNSAVLQQAHTRAQITFKYVGWENLGYLKISIFTVHFRLLCQAMRAVDLAIRNSEEICCIVVIPTLYCLDHKCLKAV